MSNAYCKNVLRVELFHLLDNRNIRDVYEQPSVIVACLRVVVIG